MSHQRIGRPALIAANETGRTFFAGLRQCSLADGMEALLDNLPCGYVSVSDDGKMQKVNATLAAMLGYSRGELEGWHLQKILPPGGRMFYQTHVFPLLKLHGAVEEIYIPLRTRAAVDVPMLLNAKRREESDSVLIDCVFVRMLQRHEFEDQLVQARRVAEEASAAKAKFLSMMSHDLRTPLSTMLTYAALVGRNELGETTEDQRDAMQEIRSAGGELLRMLNDILDFAQLEGGKVPVRLLPVSAAAAARRAQMLVREQAREAGIVLIVDVPDEVEVIADPDRLQQILLNLLTNALKFTQHGGRVSVTCRQDDSVTLRVEDTGIGIPPHELTRIFDPFVQLGDPVADTSQRGVGLGLAISRELARAMSGDLRAESTPGAGSVFTVELPAAAVAV